MSRIGAEAWTAVKFGIVGLINTAVDYGAFMLLAGIAGLGREPSQVAAYCLGVANSYILNSRFTFKAKRSGQGGRLLRFLAVNAVSLGASIGILALTGEWPLALAKLAAVGASISVNYAGSRFWAFKDAA